ncbi:hypothetical protein Aduo_006410 [Ancylostoma duodenale]
MRVLIVILAFTGTATAWPGSCPKLEYDNETARSVESASNVALSEVWENVTTNQVARTRSYGYRLRHWIHYKGTPTDITRLPPTILTKADEYNKTLEVGKHYVVVYQNGIFKYALLDCILTLEQRLKLGLRKH